MNFLKIIFTASIVAVFGFAIPSAHALTSQEIQALIAQLQEQIAQLQKQLTETEPQAWCHTFNTNLRIGDVSEEVAALQIALQKAGLIKEEVLGNEFDERIASAIVGFQERYKNEVLAPFKLARGTGFVGSGTRAKLNKLYGCATTSVPPIQTPTPTPTPIPVPTPTPIPTPTLVPSITVLSPNGGETWNIGGTYTVKWTSANLQGGEVVAIFLIRDQGTYELAGGSANASDNIKTVTVPVSIPVGSYKIQIVPQGKSIAGWGQSSGYISVVKAAVPSVIVLSPNGEYGFYIGDTVRVRWSASGISKVRIHVVEKGNLGSGSTNYITPNNETVSASQGYYDWKIDSKQLPKGGNGTYIIRIWDADSETYDESDTPFIIKENPALIAPIITSITPASITQGQTAGVAIYGSNLSGVDIKSGSCGLNASALGGFILGSCSVQPTYISVEITVANEASVGPRQFIITTPSGTSNAATFTVLGSLKITSPNGGESWKIGETYNITWSYSGPTNKIVQIELGLPAADGPGIVSNVHANAQSYSWQVPLLDVPARSDYRVIIRETSPSYTFLDSSDSYFSIAAPYSVTSFNYIETSEYNGSVKFSWANEGSDFVNLQIPCYSGLTIKNAATGGSFACGPSDLHLPSNGSLYLQFTNASSSAINANATVAPITGDATIHNTYSKAVNFSIAPTGLGLNSVEDQLASIQSVAAKLIEAIKALQQ